MLFRLTASGVAALVALCATASAGYIPVDLSSRFNVGQPAQGFGTFPTGPQTFGGVPFTMGTQESYMWFAGTGGESSVQVLRLFVNIREATAVHTILNTALGRLGQRTIRFEFFGTGGAYHLEVLEGNDDVRDFNFNFFTTNNVNDTTTTRVWNNGQGQRLDKQVITLPRAFRTGTLTEIRLTDTGSNTTQRSLLAAVTVDGVPAPGAGAVLLGAAWFAARRRRS